MPEAWFIRSDSKRSNTSYQLPSHPLKALRCCHVDSRSTSSVPITWIRVPRLPAQALTSLAIAKLNTHHVAGGYLILPSVDKTWPSFSFHIRPLAGLGSHPEPSARLRARNCNWPMSWLGSLHLDLGKRIPALISTPSVASYGVRCTAVAR